ncbi:glucan biosynthesis protein [Henriciella aquimarina]|uniref:glucan biosynthesis protein n=1 Tax=Henriciella aquimarina TaxID=545261 RepID=UPI000A05DE7E|nr:glucan biosynthesis protein G [Henriciella aquimarina]
MAGLALAFSIMACSPTPQSASQEPSEPSEQADTTGDISPAAHLQTIAPLPVETAPNALPGSGETTGAPASETAASETSGMPATSADGEPVIAPLTLSPANPATPALTRFSFAQVREKAKALAAKDYKAPAGAPKEASSLNYDQYRRIQFNDEAAIWPEGEHGYRVMLDPRGYLFNQEITINLVEEGQVSPRPYRPEDFDFLDLPVPGKVRDTLGFAGFRVLTPLNQSGKFDEVISFRGASFFRALGTGSVYGASSRGLGIGTASPEGEEFPYFTEFWLEKPKPGTEQVTLYALLDGPSVTGAFKFTVQPGVQTAVDVEASFYPRREVNGIGLAPITSMYFFSPHDLRKQANDFRPAVHDSEGLAIHMANGEWAWRPLVNPAALQVSALAGSVPRGFGLIQRQRGFDAYSDFEAQYYHRPNVWIEPQSGWQDGELMLVEIPTINEFNDNIVAFWRPENAWTKGNVYNVSYRMRWGLSSPAASTIAVKATRAGKTLDGKREIFVIDYDVPDATMLEGAEPEISSSAGEIKNAVIKRLPNSDKVRLSFELDAQATNVAELRALLVRAGKPLTETWLYRWRAE